MTISLRKSRFSLSLVVLLAWRNLWRNKRRTLITAMSIAVSFAFALVVQTLNDGAHAGMIENAIKLGNGHVAVQAQGYETNPANFKLLNNHPLILNKLAGLTIDGLIQPRITLNVLATTAHNSLAASIEAAEIGTDSRFKLFHEYLVVGQWLHVDAPDEILIGSEMASKLGVKEGNKIVFMSANESGDTVAFMARVRGIFRANIEELDKFLVLSTLPFAQKFLLAERDSIADPVTRISILLNHPEYAESLRTKIQSQLKGSNIEALTWQQMMPDVLQFIKVDDAGGYIFLGLILVMVVFGVANTLFMSVLERSREFALLHVIGLSRLNLVITIFVETLFLSAFSLAVGWVLGYGAHYYFMTQGIDVSSATENSLQIAGTFMDPTVYSKLSSDRAIQFTSVAFVSTMLVGVYPALRAGRVTPVKALQS